MAEFTDQQLQDIAAYFDANSGDYAAMVTAMNQYGVDANTLAKAVDQYSRDPSLTQTDVQNYVARVGAGMGDAGFAGNTSTKQDVYTDMFEEAKAREASRQQLFREAGFTTAAPVADPFYKGINNPYIYGTPAPAPAVRPAGIGAPVNPRSAAGSAPPAPTPGAPAPAPGAPAPAPGAPAPGGFGGGVSPFNPFPYMPVQYRPEYETPGIAPLYARSYSQEFTPSGGLMSLPKYSTTQKIREQFEKLSTGNQNDLDKFFLTMPYTAQQLSEALPFYSQTDLQKAIDAATERYGQSVLNKTGDLSVMPPPPAPRYDPAAQIRADFQRLTQQGNQSALNEYLRTSGFGAEHLAAALPFYSRPDLQAAIDKAWENWGSSVIGRPVNPPPPPAPPAPAPAPAPAPECVDPETLISISSSQATKAGDLKVGDHVYTMHENTFKYGTYEVVHAETVTQPKLAVTFDDGSVIKVSTSHKFLLTNDDWQRADALEIGDKVRAADGINDKGFKAVASIESIGDGPVVHLTIDDAHTYISDGLVSHNKAHGGLIGYARGGSTDVQRMARNIREQESDAARMKRVMAENGLSISDVARMTGIPASAVRDYLERG